MAGEFVQWNPTKANQQTDAEWQADAQRLGGALNPSIFTSKRANKLFYQLSTMAVALANSLTAKGYSVSDADVTALTTVLGNLVAKPDFYAVDTGTANNYQIALSVTTGMPVYFLAGNTNTTAAQLTCTNLGAKWIKKQGTMSLTGGEIVAGSIVGVVYDGTNFQLSAAGGSMLPPKAIYSGTYADVSNLQSGFYPDAYYTQLGGGSLSVYCGTLVPDTYKSILSVTGSGVLQRASIKWPEHTYDKELRTTSYKLIIDDITVKEGSTIYSGIGIYDRGLKCVGFIGRLNMYQGTMYDETFVFNRNMSIWVKSTINETNDTVLEYKYYTT